MEFIIQKIAENLWVIEQKGVRAFLLTGRDHAILVDTCFGGDILSVCRSLTSNPITLITTHADPDHMGCDAQFEKQHLHEADFKRYESRSKTPLHAAPRRKVMFSTWEITVWKLSGFPAIRPAASLCWTGRTVF